MGGVQAFVSTSHIEGEKRPWSGKHLAIMASAMAVVGIEERMAAIEGASVQIDKRLGRLEWNSRRSEATFEVCTRKPGRSGEKSTACGRRYTGEIRNVYRMMLAVLIPMWVTIIGSIIGLALSR